MGTPIPEGSRPAAPQKPYQFLEGEAAAVAQQRDEGSSALSPAGTGTLSGAGAVAPVLAQHPPARTLTPLPGHPGSTRSPPAHP